MKNFPLFTTSSGVASLTLEEIPYSQQAYIRLHSCTDPAALLEECKSFCTAVGATQVFATGHDYLEKYPVYTDLVKMCVSCDRMENTDVCLFPLQEKTLEQWRQIYNDRMKDVPLRSYMTTEKAKKIAQKGNGYFVHRDGQLLGIGVVSGSSIDVIISTMPGMGQKVLSALCTATDCDQIYVEVATENIPAMRLYQRLGFIPVEEISRWYKII